MAYWWVSQNKTFKQDQEGGFLWTPQRDRRGACPQHWVNLSLVRKGDTLFSYVGQGIAAVMVAETDACESFFPFERTPHHMHGKDDVDAPGWIVDVAYSVFDKVMPLLPIREALLALLPKVHSPLKSDGSGALGFVYALPPRAGRLLLGTIDGSIEGDLASPVCAPEVDAMCSCQVEVTERQALMQSRIGQGRFRRGLLSYWHGRCAVTGLDIEPLLRASHIKPWRDANNAERLDCYNGLLLGPSYDAAFDSGLISFSDLGTIILGAGMNMERCLQLGIAPSAKLSHLHQRHLPYLSHHRSTVFNA